MKRFYIYGLATALLVFIFAGCGSSGPDDVVNDFFRSIESGDTDKAAGMMSSQLVSMMGKEKLSTALEEQTKEMKEKGGISKIEISDKEEKEESVTMNVTITYGDGSTKSEKTKLVLEEGEWKIGIAK